MDKNDQFQYSTYLLVFVYVSLILYNTLSETFGKGNCKVFQNITPVSLFRELNINVFILLFLFELL